MEILFNVALHHAGEGSASPQSSTIRAITSPTARFGVDAPAVKPTRSGSGGIQSRAASEMLRSQSL
jgi:hypothetical protein